MASKLQRLQSEAAIVDGIKKGKKERNTGLYGQNPQVKKHTLNTRGESDFTANSKNALDTSPGGDGQKMEKKNSKEIRRRWRQKRGLVLR